MRILEKIFLSAITLGLGNHAHGVATATVTSTTVELRPAALHRSPAPIAGPHRPATEIQISFRTSEAELLRVSPQRGLQSIRRLIRSLTVPSNSSSL